MIMLEDVILGAAEMEEVSIYMITVVHTMFN